MGCTNSKQKVQSNSIISCCLIKKKVKPGKNDNKPSIKEVFNLFIIIDYLPLKELCKVSRISRGFYWLCGNQIILQKFQIETQDKKESLEKQHSMSGLTNITDGNSAIKNTSTDEGNISQKSEESKSRTPRRKLQIPFFKRRHQTGIYGKEYQMFKRQMDKRFVITYGEKLIQYQLYHQARVARLQQTQDIGKSFQESNPMIQDQSIPLQYKLVHQQQHPQTIVIPESMVFSGYYVFERLESRMSGQSSNNFNSLSVHEPDLTQSFPDQANKTNKQTPSKHFQINHQSSQTIDNRSLTPEPQRPSGQKKQQVTSFDFITDEPALFTQKQTPFLISSQPRNEQVRDSSKATKMKQLLVQNTRIEEPSHNQSMVEMSIHKSDIKAQMFHKVSHQSQDLDNYQMLPKHYKSNQNERLQSNTLDKKMVVVSGSVSGSSRHKRTFDTPQFFGHAGFNFPQSVASYNSELNSQVMSVKNKNQILRLNSAGSSQFKGSIQSYQYHENDYQSKDYEMKDNPKIGHSKNLRGSTHKFLETEQDQGSYYQLQHYVDFMEGTSSQRESQRQSITADGVGLHDNVKQKQGVTVGSVSLHSPSSNDVRQAALSNMNSMDNGILSNIKLKKKAAKNIIDTLQHKKQASITSGESECHPKQQFKQNLNYSMDQREFDSDFEVEIQNPDNELKQDMPPYRHREEDLQKQKDSLVFDSSGNAIQEGKRSGSKTLKQSKKGTHFAMLKDLQSKKDRGHQSILSPSSINQMVTQDHNLFKANLDIGRQD